MSDTVETATLADIYARQGHFDRARAIYEKLVAARPDDAALAARFEALLARAAAGEPPDHGLAVSDTSTVNPRVAQLEELLTRVRERRRR